MHATFHLSRFTFHALKKDFQMALQIVADLCTACADCEEDCPTASIRRKKGVYIINPDTCTECEGDYDKPKCVQLCPIDNCIIPLAA